MIPKNSSVALAAVLFSVHIFLPMMMRTSCFAYVVSCRLDAARSPWYGDIESAKPFLSAYDASTSFGRSLKGSFWKSSRVSVEVNPMCIPTSWDRPTAPTSQFFRKTDSCSLPVFGEKVGFHPASLRTPHITVAKDIASSSPETAKKLKDVPLNGFSEWANKSTWPRSLGILSRSYSAWALAACLRASARSVSAFAAFSTASAELSLADLISLSNESASWRAPRARVCALPAATPAALDMSFASPASFFACPAFPAAVLAEALASVSSWILIDWILSSSEFTHPSTQNSPATPTETRIHPTRPMSVINAGSCSHSDRPVQRLTNLMMLYTSSGPSNITPHATNWVIRRSRPKSCPRTICRPFLFVSRALIASGDNSAMDRIKRNEEQMRSFNRKMCAFATAFIVVVMGTFIIATRKK